MNDVEVLTQLTFIVVGIVFGTLGVILLLYGKPRHRIVGVMLTPIIVAMLFFLLNFSSNSTADFGMIGQAGGAFAGYLITFVALYRLARPVIDLESLQSENQSLSQMVRDLKEKLQHSEHDLVSVQHDYNRIKQQMDNRAAPPVRNFNRVEYLLPDKSGRSIIIQNGDIEKIKTMGIHVDVIVSSENTDMMLARYYDGSISGTLRYMDASRDSRNYIAIDNLGNSLQGILDSLNAVPPVGRGAVYATPTTELAKRGIRYVFHAAAVYGKRSIRGYETDGGMLDLCVENAFTCFDELANVELSKGNPAMQSIMFPLFGAGTAKLSAQLAAEILVNAILTHMRDSHSVKITYLLAYTETDLQAWTRALDQNRLAIKESE